MPKDNTRQNDLHRRASGTGSNRLARTVVLGCVAVGFGLYWLAGAFEIDAREFGGYLLTSIGFVLVIAAAAIGAGVLLGWLRRRR